MASDHGVPALFILIILLLGLSGVHILRLIKLTQLILFHVKIPEPD